MPDSFAVYLQHSASESRHDLHLLDCSSCKSHHQHCVVAVWLGRRLLCSTSKTDKVLNIAWQFQQGQRTCPDAGVVIPLVLAAPKQVVL
jgi:hypothetical protein